MDRRKPAEIEQYRGAGFGIAIAVGIGWIVLTGAPVLIEWVLS